MIKLYRIIKGWMIFLFRPKSQMAIARLDACLKCPHRRGRFCGICWCELDAKAEIEEEHCPDPDGSRWPI